MDFIFVVRCVCVGLCVHVTYSGTMSFTRDFDTKTKQNLLLQMLLIQQF